MIERPARDDLLRRALDRMAHQIKNPLQAVAMNLEVVRSRIRSAAPEAWASVERFADAVDANVGVLDRRLRLLLALGRRGTDSEEAEVDAAALVRDFAAALGVDEAPPGVRVEGSVEVRGRAREGWLLALLLEAWSAAAAGGVEELPVTVSVADGHVRLAMDLPPAAAAELESWEAIADRAGATLGSREEGPATRLLVDLPTAGRRADGGTTEPSGR